MPKENEMGNKLQNDEAVLGLAASVTGRACELITDGWVKGQMHTTVEGAEESFCIHGALNVAIREVFGEMQNRSVAQQDVADVAVAFICDEAFNQRGTRINGDHGIPAAAMNDAASTTHDDVIGVMSRASARLWDLTVESECDSYVPSRWANVDTDSEQAKQYLYATLGN
jgi:hypothetical protein